MKIVTLPFREGTSEQESHRGVTISRWLKEQGVIMGRDYTWRVDQNRQELQFMFNGQAESWATLITLKDL
jgi:hypothetical protein